MTTHLELIDAVREVTDADGWRLSKSQLTEDYERGERRIVLTVLQSSGVQESLPLGDGES